jgi:hypothetical protein
MEIPISSPSGTPSNIPDVATECFVIATTTDDGTVVLQ